MQYLMMSKNRFYNIFLQKSVNFLISLFYVLAPYLPRIFMRCMSIFILVPIYVFRPKYNRAIINNLQHILPETTSRLHYHLMIFKIYRNFANYFIDLFYFRRKSDDQIKMFLENIQSISEFETELNREQGIVMLTAHIGNWELGSYFLATKNRPVNVVYFQDRFKEFESMRSTIRAKMHIKEINVGTGHFSGLPIIRALRNKEIVAMQGDRDFRNDGIEVSFFGEQVPFPSGPVLCAMASNSIIIPVFILASNNRSYKILNKPAVSLSGDLKDSEQVRSNVQKLAKVIEEVVAQYPDQWYCFYPFFHRNWKIDN